MCPAGLPCYVNTLAMTKEGLVKPTYPTTSAGSLLPSHELKPLSSEASEGVQMLGPQAPGRRQGETAGWKGLRPTVQLEVDPVVWGL